LRADEIKTIGVVGAGLMGFYPWTDERIERVSHQRDDALLKIIEVIKGLSREK
jgi:hypothetical protein